MDCPIEDLVVDGDTEGGAMDGDGTLPPFALFSPALQENVGGPYATRQHADAALDLIRQGRMVPYTNRPITWTVDGRPSRWYEGG